VGVGSNPRLSILHVAQARCNFADAAGKADALAVLKQSKVMATVRGVNFFHSIEMENS